jgi:tetratricopeptide (TPR) repeat protein
MRQEIDRPRRFLAGECPSEMTLASFIDGKLAANEHAVVANHIVSCRDCYETFAGVVSMEEPVPLPLRFFSVRRFPTILPIAAATLVGAFLSIFVAYEIRKSDPLLQPIVTAAANLSQRPIEPRVHGLPDQKWESVRGRHAIEDPSMTRLRQVALGVAYREGNDPKTLHARGVAELLLGRKEEAIRDLTAAANAKPHNAVYWSDLAAAYLEGGSNGPAPAAALRAADRALSIDSDLQDAAFNRALALEKLGREAAAIEAYERYLRKDSTSQFAREAARSLHRLRLRQRGD